MSDLCIIYYAFCVCIYFYSIKLSPMPRCTRSGRCSATRGYSPRRSRRSPWPRGTAGCGTPAWSRSSDPGIMVFNMLYCLYPPGSCWAGRQPSQSTARWCSGVATPRCRGGARHVAPVTCWPSHGQHPLILQPHLGDCSQPVPRALPHLGLGQQLVLQPVVDTWHTGHVWRLELQTDLHEVWSSHFPPVEDPMREGPSSYVITLKTFAKVRLKL